MKSKSRADWGIPLFLFLFGALSVARGVFRLVLIEAGPPEVLDEFSAPHYYTMPVPIILHIITGCLFSLLAPLQFWPRVRQHWPIIHRVTGRALIPLGLLAALSALWMNAFYPAFGGPLKYTAVLSFGVFMIVALSLGLRAILRRDIARHRIWMMRAMAISLGPTTQMFYFLPLYFTLDNIAEWLFGLGVWVGFAVNALIVEVIIRRHRRPARPLLGVQA